MSVDITNIAVTSSTYGDDEQGTQSLPSPSFSAPPPLLYPTCINGSITLPKITSQMIRKEPLVTKYCQLNLTACHLTVDFCALNAIEVLNFT
jgi:hypothetical protein